MVKNGSVVSEKSKFSFSYVNNLGPSSRNDIDLQYSRSTGSGEEDFDGFLAHFLAHR